MSRILNREQIEATAAVPRLTDDTLLANARMHREVAEDTWRRTVEVLEHIEYKDGYEVLVLIEENAVWLQPRFWRIDVVTGMYGWGYGGKGRVTETCTTSQLVQMVFGLFKALEEHEAREHFMYLGERVFGPHIDINALVEVASDTDHQFPRG